jgi:threonine dehydrogenase-like Zn-dependent dehydrogenase
MKAFVMGEIGQVGFMDKPMPKPGPGDAIVRTTKALICKVGLAHGWRRDWPAAQPHPRTRGGRRDVVKPLITFS